MLDNEPEGGERTGTNPVHEPAVDTTASPQPPATDTPAEAAAPTRRRTTRRKAVPAKNGATSEPGASIEAQDAEETREAAAAAPPVATRRRRTAKAAAPAAEPTGPVAETAAALPAAEAGTDDLTAAAPAPVKATRSRRKAAAPVAVPPQEPAPAEADVAAPGPVVPVTEEPPAEDEPAAPAVPAVETEVAPSRRRRGVALPPAVLFIPPSAETPVEPVTRRGRRRTADPEPVVADTPAAAAADPVAVDEPVETGRRRRRGRRDQADEVEIVAVADLEAPDESVGDVEDGADDSADDTDDEDDDSAAARRRRRRGRRGRGRGKGPLDDDADETDEPTAAAEEDPEEGDDEADEGDGVTRRRRRRRRKGAGDTDIAAPDDGVHTVVRIREPRTRERADRSDEVQGVSGSTRLEAKRQRRRDGREQRRTRPPILSESEFLARREAVDRVMVIRQKPDRTQIAVLEDGVLVEHYVARATSGTMVGNVYLGKVQNVLPSMEAAFVDVGRGRNAVLYAGEVNWDVSGLEGRARSIEQALRSGDSVMVQVTKDPIGHKGARLTSHIALSGRHLVYVPHGNASGISRKLPDNERKRLRDVLKKLVPDGAGVIVRTAAEGASEDELARDVKRLQSQWEDIQARAAEGNAPALLSEEPDLVVRVVRDLFNEDFRELVIEGDQAYGEVENYLTSVSPDLVERLHRHTGTADVFAQKRIDEQILKGLDRKVFLPSGGHLVIDRTEAMTVVDVNTGKYTGAGGNLEETVTRNNLEAAEETVRQLRLRDIGGIVVIDFIDMVLESNRDLVLRRLTECLGRDRTKHQVTEITSLGLVQMTRKRIGAGLLEVFSETCEHCKGRGLIMHTEPVTERGRPAIGAAEKVKAVASAPPPALQASPSNGTTSSRRRGRRGGGDTAEAPVATDAPAVDAPAGDTPALETPAVETPAERIAEQVPERPRPVAGSGVIGVAPVVAADQDDDEYDISGYDLSRYEAPEPLQLTGSDDPDADGADEGDEEPAGAGGRRRSRRSGTRRRTRP